MPHIYKPGVSWNTCDNGYLTEFENYDLKDITTKAWIVGKLCGGLAGLGTVGGICNGADVMGWGRPRDVAGTAQVQYFLHLILMISHVNYLQIVLQPLFHSN